MRVPGRARRGEEEKKGAPAYIVSYADIVTNLLAFFILLQVFASFKDPALFFAGRGSFIRALEGFGIPGLVFGDDRRLSMETNAPAYTVEGPSAGKPASQVTDAEAERIEEMLEEIEQSFTVDPVTDRRRAPLVLATPLRFRSGEAVLDEGGEAYLLDLWKDLIGFGGGRRIEVEIRGFAQDVAEVSRRRALAAARAAAVERFLSRLQGLGGGERRWVIRSAGSAVVLPGGQRDLYVLIQITEV